MTTKLIMAFSLHLDINDLNGWVPSKMPKSNHLSIFLLKDGETDKTALVNGSPLFAAGAQNLPVGGKVFIFRRDPKPPWWKTYFSISDDLDQATAGAIAFVPADGRWFVATFGHVQHYLADGSYEYDFGLRVSLNCLKPDELKSTDTLQPSGAKRQRIQFPKGSRIASFEIDHDATIVKSVTGRVDDAHLAHFKNATGSSSIRISSPTPAKDLPTLCQKLLQLYTASDHERNFSEFQNISPIKDPIRIQELDNILLKSIIAHDANLQLSIPEIIDYRADHWIIFRGFGSKTLYTEATMENYYQALGDEGFDLKTLDLRDLKRVHSIALTDESTAPHSPNYPLFKCLIFETVLAGKNEVFHLCEGNWYLVSRDLLKRLKGSLDPYFQPSRLIDCSETSEEAYNKAAAKSSALMCNLDQTDISPKKQTQIEPCDILELSGGEVIFHSVKISDVSSQLSHLFNQGSNAVTLLIDQPQTAEALKNAVKSRIEHGNYSDFSDAIDSAKWRVVFDIVTRKDPRKKSDNLPLFSRISLDRVLRAIKRMRLPAEVSFVPNKTSPKKVPKAKKAKKSSS